MPESNRAIEKLHINVWHLTTSDQPLALLLCYAMPKQCTMTCFCIASLLENETKQVLDVCVAGLPASQVAKDRPSSQTGGQRRIQDRLLLHRSGHLLDANFLGAVN